MDSQVKHILSQEVKSDNLCLAGGVALNCVANGKILEKKIFENILRIKHLLTIK